MFSRNESITGEFFEVETGGNHDTTITNDLMFEFMMDHLDMQNTVFCSSGSQPCRLWEPLPTFERRLLREYVKDNKKVMNSATILNEFTFIFIMNLTAEAKRKPVEQDLRRNCVNSRNRWSNPTALRKAAVSGCETTVP